MTAIFAGIAKRILSSQAGRAVMFFLGGVAAVFIAYLDFRT
jgi:hypothetical protein